MPWHGNDISERRSERDWTDPKEFYARISQTWIDAYHTVWCSIFSDTIIDKSRR